MAERIESLYPKIKFMFMSGYTADVIAHRGTFDEGVYVLHKAFTKKDLAATVRTVLDK